MTIESTHADVVIIGGGAAGLLCAIEAGKRGRSVMLLEHNESVGKKIRISGGGRCNFTNIGTDAKAFVSQNPHFCKSALARYTPSDFIELVERHGIAWHEKTLGQLFCNDSAQQIIDMLVKECTDAGVRILTGCTVDRVSKDGNFICRTSRGNFTSSSLVIASGGLSIPALGATSFGHSLAELFGLSLTNIRPGLVPLLWSKADRAAFGPLSGVSFPGRVTCGDASFDESILFTHRGLSGPAILQASSYWRPGMEISIDVGPGEDIEGAIFVDRERNIIFSNFLGVFLPKRFATVWAEQYTENKTLARTSSPELREIAAHLHDWRITPAGTEGYEKAEVTVGGISTDELSSKTMEARNVPGLYCIGEVVDVTGHLGGYNFQWAWASGFAAGQVA